MPSTDECLCRNRKPVSRITTPHYVIEKLVVTGNPIPGLEECTACGEFWCYEPFGDAATSAYLALLQDRITTSVRKLEAAGVSPFFLERTLGLSVEELDEPVTDEKKASLLNAALAAFLAHPDPKAAIDNYKKWMNE
jgi:hypothetical protein